ncbi:uncharacterized protein LOC126664942 [Mercurialis annua]|uniref:uncharacterized protein LOC126664942 n=1 Tax=Mercurialis annua TaxID=3986 RepID=UPI00215ECDF0|nr:uncharacterized protein LOC126664942 [Mercurialis annua]
MEATFHIPKLPSIFHLISFSLLLLITTPPSPATATPTETATETLIKPSNFLSYYTQRCNDVVPQSPLNNSPINFALGEDAALHFDIAYFTGGQQLLRSTNETLFNSTQSDAVSLSFHPRRGTMSFTRTPRVLYLQATLRFRLRIRFKSRNLRQIRFRSPRFPVPRNSLEFQLYGFWSMDTGKLCMVGSSSLSFAEFRHVSNSNAVLKLDYTVGFSNFSSLINGVLESVNDKDSLSYFEPISILGLPVYGHYNYTLINDSVCSQGNDRVNESLHLDWLDSRNCLSQLSRYARNFELDYGKDCGRNGGGKCDPRGGGGNYGNLPKLMTVKGLRCEYGEGGFRVLIGFPNSYYSSESVGYERPFDPNTMLVGEGVWDEKTDRLCVVACRVLNIKESLVNASVGDCSIHISLWFPKTLTIMERNTMVGHISSNSSVNATGYFDRIRVRGHGNLMRGLKGFKYEYTMLDRVSKSCPRKIARSNGKAYPEAYSTDMRFEMSLVNGKKHIAQGFSSPLFVGEQIYEPYQRKSNHSGLLNISYSMTFAEISDFQLGSKLLSHVSAEISAEGTYDNRTGLLCMIGCLHIALNSINSTKDDRVDCEVLVTVQFSPLNANGGNNIKGTIKSMRANTDPLYFRKLEISSNSIYQSQATQSIWRMDMEITMVLISNTLACLFIGLQLYHVKKHPDVLPSISFLMLIVLTLGYMIPLLLNVEALFVPDHSRHNVVFESNRWLELNEVIVRVVTMIAFVLLFCLLQLSWSARNTDESRKSLWVSEKKVLYLSLPFYIGGGLIAWYACEWKDSYKNPYLRRDMNFPLKSLKAYGGLILDCFLLPQIIFNVFLNSKGKTLSYPFYIGKTLVLLLPHAYDLYRASSSTWSFDISYLYGNHKLDFYSTTWDIIIPFVSLLFVALIYLQQRFGGRCVLPRKFRDTSVYEKIPVVSSEEVQAEAKD